MKIKFTREKTGETFTDIFNMQQKMAFLNFNYIGTTKDPKQGNKERDQEKLISIKIYQNDHTLEIETVLLEKEI